MQKFRELFLDPDWWYDIVRSVLNEKKCLAMNFFLSTPTNRVITGKNNHLWGTESCLDDMRLKNNMTMKVNGCGWQDLNLSFG
jgi:hypothetical protein